MNGTSAAPRRAIAPFPLQFFAFLHPRSSFVFRPACFAFVELSMQPEGCRRWRHLPGGWRRPRVGSLAVDLDVFRLFDVSSVGGQTILSNAPVLPADASPNCRQTGHRFFVSSKIVQLLKLASLRNSFRPLQQSVSRGSLLKHGLVIVPRLETDSIEAYAAHLVDLLESCLDNNLIPKNFKDEDTPHAKIASDLLSCIFLYYTKKSVMAVAIPTAVKMLSKSSRALVRNTSSYLALAAIYNARLLSQYALPILQSIRSGNYSLIRVLHQIYSENKEPFHAYLYSLLQVFDHCDTSEKLSLLQLCCSIATNKPDLMVPLLGSFRSSLFSTTTCVAVLNIYAVMVDNRYADHLTGQWSALKKCLEILPSSQLGLVAKILSSVGLVNRESAQDAVSTLVVQCYKVDSNNVVSILKEIRHVADFYPDVVRPFIPELNKLAGPTPPALRSAVARIQESCSKSYNAPRPVSNEKVTIISVDGGGGGLGGSANYCSKESLHSGISRAIAKTTQDLSSSTASSNLLDNSASMLGTPLLYKGMVTPPTGMSKVATALSRSIGSLVVPPYRISGGKLPSYQTYQATRAQQLEKIRRELPVPTVAAAGSYFTSNVCCPSSSQQVVKRNASLTDLQLCQKPVFVNSPVFLHIPNGHAAATADYAYRSVDFDGQSSSGLQRKQRYHPRTFNRPVTTFNNDLSVSQRASSDSIKAIANGGAGDDAISKLSAGMEEARTPSVGHRHHRMVVTVNQMSELRSNPKMVDAYTQSVTTLPLRPRLADIVPLNRANSSTNHDSIVKGDAMRQFCDKHYQKIKNYVSDLSTKYPVPCQCTVEESGSKQIVRIHFACQERSNMCLYSSTCFAFKTKIPHLWLHLMFLHLQAQSPTTLDHSCEAVRKLKTCWECLTCTSAKSKSFTALVTSAFPNFKEQQMLLSELQVAGYYDLFAYNATKKKWSCFACNHPERVKSILKQSDSPVIEGQLKEKKGRWKFFKRWRTRYFTLSGASLSYKNAFTESPAIELRSIRSVKSLSCRRGRRTIPKAFEIFTDDDCSYVLKAKDHRNAEEWFQCLQIAVAQAHRGANTYR